jgi:hypothetical protein
MFILFMIYCCISELEVIQKFAKASSFWGQGADAAALAVQKGFFYFLS